jgi:hypothetical protein
MKELSSLVVILISISWMKQKSLNGINKIYYYSRWQNYTKYQFISNKKIIIFKRAPLADENYWTLNIVDIYRVHYDEKNRSVILNYIILYLSIKQLFNKFKAYRNIENSTMSNRL